MIVFGNISLCEKKKFIVTVNLERESILVIVITDTVRYKSSRIREEYLTTYIVEIF